MHKILYIILDGLADLPIREFGNKTPLEASLALNLDRLAQNGATGLVYPVGKGLIPESDVAVISLLGYEAKDYYTGRGPLEAFAEGMKINKGELALRVNFASAGEAPGEISDRRAGRDLTLEEAGALAKEINSKVSLSSATFEFKNTICHRGVLVIRGMRSKLSGAISNTDPAYKREGMFGLPQERFAEVVTESHPLAGFQDSPEAVQAAALLNEFTEKSQAVLKDSPVNKKRVSEGKLPADLILARDAGDALPEFPAITSRYGLRFGCFVEMPVERGIALLTGMEIIPVPSSCGHRDVDYSVWAKVALDALKKYDGIYVQIKGPDDPGHDRDCAGKKAVIEDIDKFFFGSLLPELDLKHTIIAVTGDHTTLCATGSHSKDPLPLLISGPGVSADGSLSFSEKSCASGSLGEFAGKEILPLLVKYAREE